MTNITQSKAWIPSDTEFAVILDATTGKQVADFASPHISEDEAKANLLLALAAPSMKSACEAAEQCIVDLIDVYKRNCSMFILDEAVKSLRHDALAKVRIALAKLRMAA